MKSMTQESQVMRGKGNGESEVTDLAINGATGRGVGGRELHRQDLWL